ncbi:hypothetical protein ACET3Z_010746 [Daucus carota]
MDKPGGRKRVPLSPLSPSSTGNFGKRRLCLVIVVVFYKAGNDLRSSPVQGSTVPSPMVIDVDGLTPRACYSSNLSPSSRHLNHFTTTDVTSCGKSPLSGITVSRNASSAQTSYKADLTPSERRMRFVNLSEIGSNSPVSRLINSTTEERGRQPSRFYELPSSRIEPKNKMIYKNDHSRFNKNFNIDRGVDTHQRIILDKRMTERCNDDTDKHRPRVTKVSVASVEELGVQVPSSK